MSEMPAACLATQEDLSALIDEELAPQREAEVRAHLARCDRCARRLEELCNVDLVLAGLPAPGVAPKLRAKLAERIAEHERHEAQPAGPARREGALRQAPPPRPRLGRRVAALAALAAAAALALFTTLRSGETPEPGAPQLARPAPQARPAPSPEPGGEPLLARQPAAEAEPPLGKAAPTAQPGAAPVEIAGTAPPAPEAEGVEIARVPPPPEATAVGSAKTPPAGLDDLSEEDLALLLELDAVEDLDVIANLELLEDLLELEGTGGAG